MTPSEWIRPKGCEGGACVEYRTVGDTVTIRGTVTAEEMRVTVAEWEAFVAGLTTVRLAAVEDERDFHAAHAERIATIADTIAAANRRKREANAALAAENESLAADLAKADRERDSLARRCAVRFEETEKLRTERASILAATELMLNEVRAQRDAAIAEAAVLRRYYRRTQAVVEAAVALHAGFAARKPGGGSAELCGLERAVEDYLKGPQTGLSATESPEQPPVEGTATDGLEAQGGAQQAAEASRVWDKGEGPVAWLHVPEPRRPVPHEITTTSFDNDWTCSCGASGRSNATAHVYSNTPAVTESVQAFVSQPLTEFERRAGVIDPGEVPEAGRAGEAQTVTETSEASSAQQVIKRELWARLDEVMHPAGSMHETELSTTTLGDWLGDRVYAALIDAGLEPGAAKIQDRTEGLDAAIEAARNASCEHIYELSLLGPCMECRIRAASPLIERAALHAAADEIQDAYEDMDYTDSRADGIEFVLILLRDRATRTETS